ncbi:MAG: glycoside hydrolase, partial [Pseudomonadota bacterium]
ELTGGTGADDLRGGAGDDLFIFNSGDGADVIRDFSEGAGAGDVIRLVGVSGVNSFADVMAAASMAGSATLLTFSGGDQLRLQGVAMGDLAADDFLFA